MFKRKRVSLAIGAMLIFCISLSPAFAAEYAGDAADVEETQAENILEETQEEGVVDTTISEDLGDVTVSASGEMPKGSILSVSIVKGKEKNKTEEAIADIRTNPAVIETTVYDISENMVFVQP